MTLLERVVSVIAPHDCLVCGHEGALICNWCREAACPPLPERCYGCLVASENSLTCYRCRRESPLKHVWVCADYESTASQLVRKLKFQRGQAAAAVIASYLQATLPYLNEDVIIAHLPTATSRVRARGYDHAALIARNLARNIGRRHLPLLARLGHSRQVGAKRDERQRQLVGAFRPRQASIIRGAHILLVDDVVTTGASLEAAARVLRRAGARRVDAAVFAQKLKN